MPYITVNGHPQLIGKNAGNAPLRALMSLQRQTGKKMAELREEGEYSDSLNTVIMGFLSLETAGIFEKWDDLIERPITDFDIEETPEERTLRLEREAKEEAELAAAADPLSTPTDSQPPGSDEQTSTDPTPSAKPSKKTNPGSKGKSPSE